MIRESRPTVIVFDVNETLLDIEHLTPLFARLFGDGAILREWFAQLVLYSEALTLVGRYAPFAELGAAVLTMVGATKGVAVTGDDTEAMRALMSTLPAHPDVREGLARLQAAGFRLVTLTNSAPNPQADPIERAGLAAFFERRFSVDTMRKFKPAPDVYRQVADALRVDLPALCLVAAHSWDTMGAQALGCTAALVTRPGNAALPLDDLPQPQVIGADLRIVADGIIARWPASVGHPGRTESGDPR